MTQLYRRCNSSASQGWRGGLRRRGRVRRVGAVLIEAAVVILLFIVLTFAMIEYGYLIFVMHTSTGAARSGARAAVVAGAATATVKSAVDTIMSAAGFVTTQYNVQVDDIDPSSGTTRTNVDPITIPAGHDVKVHVKSTWSTIGVSTIKLVDPNRTIDTVVVMRKEG
jgi:Flp pilus assembly protein TadG